MCVYVQSIYDVIYLSTIVSPRRVQTCGTLMGEETAITEDKIVAVDQFYIALFSTLEQTLHALVACDSE